MKIRRYLALAFVRIREWFCGVEDFGPQLRRDLLFGYYGDGDRNLNETYASINLAWIYGWGDSDDALANAIEHLREAASYGVPNVVLGLTAAWGADGETWLRQYLRALSSKGLLRDVRALYPIDEPDTGDAPKTDDQVRATNAMIRRVAGEFPELAGVKLAVIYGDRGFPGVGSYDWIGFDNYPQRDAIFIDGEYEALKAALRPDQRILLVPGGVSPYEQDPAAFYNVAQRDPQVIAIVAFIWQDNAAAGIGAGIRSNRTGHRYVECGSRIKG